MGKNYHSETVRRILRKAGFHRYTIPDLNPKHIWTELSNRIKKYITDFHLRRAWNEIIPDIIKTLILSMPRRLQAIIDKKKEDLQDINTILS